MFEKIMKKKIKETRSGEAIFDLSPPAVIGHQTATHGKADR